ncbi:hypothetical protein LY78DRAFT_331869 [Colletotrichum sublineola]|nr:hypothetical protein LY78DRAFT_331869 [Colletotrichum sublineola]
MRLRLTVVVHCRRVARHAQLRNAAPVFCFSPSIKPNMFTILAALSPPGVPAMAFSLPHQEIKGQNKVGKRDKSGGGEAEMAFNSVTREGLRLRQTREGASRFAQTRLNGLRSWKMRDAYDRHHAQNGKNATEIPY